MAASTVGDLDDSASEAPGFERAIERIIDQLPGLAATRAFADRARQLIRQHLEHSPSQADLSSFSTSEVLLLAQLIDELRASVLAPGEEEGVDAAATLELLRAIENLRRSMLAGSEADPLMMLLSSSRGADLLAELAHDLRSPLTSILFLAEALRDGRSGGINDIQHQQLGIIYGAAFSMVNMAGDLIELVQGSRMLVEKEPVPFSVSEVFESSLAVLRPLLQSRKIVLRHRTPAVDHRVGHPVALNRVVLNLTANSIRHTEEGFIELSASEIVDDEVEFSVRDTGSGLDSDTMEHLYTPFRTKQGGEGLGFSGAGLGLLICRRLIRRMGGELELETSPGWGTRFFFKLRLPHAG